MLTAEGSALFAACSDSVCSSPRRKLTPASLKSPLPLGWGKRLQNKKHTDKLKKKEEKNTNQFLRMYILYITFLTIYTTLYIKIVF